LAQEAVFAGTAGMMDVAVVVAVLEEAHIAAGV